MALNALNKMLKSGGGLLVGERQTEEAAKNNGLAAPATSPLGLSTLGVTPDAAKMGGTSQQKMAANKQSLAPAKTDTAQTAISEADRKSRKQAQAVQGLQQKGSTLDSRVNNLVVDRLNTATSTNTVDATIGGLVNASGLKDEPSKALFTKFLNTRGVLESAEYEKLARDLGIIGPKDVVKDAEQLKTQMKAQYFDSKQGKLTASINQKVTVGDIAAAPGGQNWAKDLGFDDENSLAEFLGLVDKNGNPDPSQLRAKSVKELNDTIDTRVSTVFSQTAAQQAILNDPSSSDLEKEQAAAALGQLSGRGVIAGEQEASRGAEGLRGAETVAFKGQEFRLEDLLQNQVFINEATEYYKKSPQDRQKLKDSAPPTEKALYGWLDSNEANLSSLETAIGQNLDTVQKGTTEAAGAYGALSGVIKDAAKLKQLTGIEGPVKFGDKKKTPTTKFGQMIESLATMQDPKYKVRAAVQIKALSEFLDSAPPEYIDLLKDKDIQWFINNNLWSESEQEGELKTKLNRWKAKRDDISFLAGDKDISVFGTSMDEYQDLVSSLATLGEDSELQRILDANKDGKLDSNKEINERLKNKMGNTDNPDTPMLGELLDSLELEAAAKYPPMLRDKEISEEESNSFMPTSFEQLEKIFSATPKTSQGTRQVLANKLTSQRPEVQKVNEAFGKQLQEFNTQEELEAYATDVVNSFLNVKNGNVHPLERAGLDAVEKTLGEFLRNKDFRMSILQQEKDKQKVIEQAAEAKKEQDAKDQAEQDKKLTSRVRAGIEDPLGALQSIPTGINNAIDKSIKYVGKRNPLKKKVKF